MTCLQMNPLLSTPNAHTHARARSHRHKHTHAHSVTHTHTTYSQTYRVQSGSAWAAPEPWRDSPSSPGVPCWACRVVPAASQAHPSPLYDADQCPPFLAAKKKQKKWKKHECGLFHARSQSLTFGMLTFEYISPLHSWWVFRWSHIFIFFPDPTFPLDQVWDK